jgi:hypothetical protein
MTGSFARLRPTITYQRASTRGVGLEVALGKFQERSWFVRTKL